MNQGKVIPKNVTLLTANLELLQTVQDDKGLTSLSAALRFVLHDWQKLRQYQISDTARKTVRIWEKMGSR